MNAVFTKTIATGTILNYDLSDGSTINVGLLSFPTRRSSDLADFTVTLGAKQSFPVSIDYSTANGAGAVVGDNESGVANIRTAVLSAARHMPIAGNTVAQADKTFSVNIGTLGNATAGNTSAAA